MFELEYKGGNGVLLTSKKASVVFDPKLSVVGLRDLKTKDAVVIASEHRFLTDEQEAKLIIDSPGEYEVGDFTIRGIAATRHIDTPEQAKLSTIYRLECGDVRIAVLGNIDGVLSDEQYETLGVIDILVLPVGGGGYTLDATSAATVVRAIGPKVVVPIHYAESGVTYEVTQDTLETFIKELGAPVESLPKLKVKSLLSLPAVLTVFQVTRS